MVGGPHWVINWHAQGEDITSAFFEESRRWRRPALGSGAPSIKGAVPTLRGTTLPDP
jgi:hypothetical protein